MKTDFVKCPNADCAMHEHLLVKQENIKRCPICNSILVSATMNQKDEENGSDCWLSAIAENDEYWIRDVEINYPSIIALEYRNLRTFCRKNEPYAALLSIKDNFEVLLKLEVLLAFAWIEQSADEKTKQQLISQLATQNLSLGSWLYFAAILSNDVKLLNNGQQGIPVNKLHELYNKAQVVAWRNTWIGHGAMGLSEDAEFHKNIEQRIKVLKEIYEALKAELCNQILYIKREEKEASGKIEVKDIELVGADKARGLPFYGKVFLKTRDGGINFCISPFVMVRKCGGNGYGIFFFDNQRKIFTDFLGYAEGKREQDKLDYFQRLRKLLQEPNVNMRATADDKYLNEEEQEQLNHSQMSHNFVKPAYLVEWIKHWITDMKYDRGVFLLQMERGTGKSVFTEQLNSLRYKPLIIDANVDVRVYHFSRTQSAGADDFCQMIKWQWTTEFGGRSWPKAPNIEGESPEEAIVSFLTEIRKYRERNGQFKKLLMILDGLDEISDRSLWEYIPRKEKLNKGLYFLLTSRNPKTEKLPLEINECLEKLSLTETMVIGRDSDENLQFLKNYVANTKLSKCSDADKVSLIKYSENRVLLLGMLCRLFEHNMKIRDLPKSEKVVEVYLKTLNEEYGEIYAHHLKNLLLLFCTLGQYEPLSVKTIAVLSGEPGITLQLIGWIRDLIPLLHVERNCERGNLYRISNPDLLDELREQLSADVEAFSISIAQMTISVLKEEALNEFPGLETAAGHIVDLILDYAESGKEALDGVNQYLDIIIENEEKEANSNYDWECILNYKDQLYKYYKQFYGTKHWRTIDAQRRLAAMCYKRGRYQQARKLNKELEENESIKNKLGAWNHNAREIEREYVLTLYENKRFEEAMERLKRLQEKVTIKYGTGSNTISLNLEEYEAHILNGQGDSEKAREVQVSVWIKYAKCFDPPLPQRWRAQCFLAILYAQSGELEKAEILIREADDIFTRLLDEKNPVRISAKAISGCIMYMRSNIPEAEKLIKEAYKTGSIGIGPEHPGILKLKNIIDLFGTTGDSERNIQYDLLSTMRELDFCLLINWDEAGKAIKKSTCLVTNDDTMPATDNDLIARHIYYNRWLKAGAALGKLEFTWAPQFEEARNLAEEIKEQILLTVKDKNLAIDETDYPSFASSILGYYQYKSTEKYSLLLSGIAFFRAGLLKVCKTKEKKIEMIRLIVSPVNMLPDWSEAEKKHIYHWIIDNADRPIENLADEFNKSVTSRSFRHFKEKNT